MRQIREILRLKHEVSLRHRAIARAWVWAWGRCRSTCAGSRAGLGRPLPLELDEAALEARLFKPGEPGRERVAPDLVWVHQELKRPGVTLHLLWEEYREVHPEGYGYSQFCELYRRWAGKLKPLMGQQHRAGEKTFIDFSGKRPHLLDRRTGEEIPVELFVAALGASSYTYAEATPTQKLSPCRREGRHRTRAGAQWAPAQRRDGILLGQTGRGGGAGSLNVKDISSCKSTTYM